MKNILRWGVLGGAVAACSQQRPLPPEMHLKQPLGPAYQQQVQLLQAEAVNFSTTRLAQGDSTLTVLNLEVLNPRNQLEQADTLRARVRKLAHLVVADLASPGAYQVVNARVLFKPGWLSFAKGDDQVSQSFIYPVARLR